MKILWLTNRILPYVADKLGAYCHNEGGWLKTLSELLIGSDKIKLISVYAADNRKLNHGYDDLCSWYGFYSPKVAETKLNRKRLELFRSIIRNEKPDLIHIWGTEYAYVLEMVCAAEGIAPVVISIQGIISEYAKEYSHGLTYDVIKQNSIHDILRCDNIYHQKRRFIKRGNLEEKTLRKSRYIIGRTKWDKEVVERINPHIKYYNCEEIVRPVFYEEPAWSVENCKRHRVFMAQSYYPIKGMHVALRIISCLRDKYPDISLYTTGRDARIRNFKDYLRQNSYEKYINSMIAELSLEKEVRYLGYLSSKNMKKQYIEANVYLQASIIENSSNALMEAMLTGTPIVASDVGGTRSVLGDYSKECLYEIDYIEQAVELIDNIFKKEESREFNSTRSMREYALDKYSVDKVFEQYICCYRDIINDTEND